MRYVKMRSISNRHWFGVCVKGCGKGTVDFNDTQDLVTPLG